MPSISDYSKLIMKEGGRAFKSLSGAQFIPSRTVPFKVMSFGSGSFAAVFKAKNQGEWYAVRCFLNDSGDKIERYRKITEYLKPIRKRWKVGFDLLENEVFIDNQHLPVLKMQWVQGTPLNEYVTRILDDFSALTKLQTKLVKLSTSLEALNIGHGDLQHGNILVVEEGQNVALKLIDYDAMYIPALKGMGGIESGMKAYQHPKRTKKDFNEKIDRFSIWVMLTAIEAVKYNKNLWQSEVHGGYNTEANFLFEGQDFLRPNESRLFRQLLKMPQASVQYYAERLKAFCTQRIDAVDFPQLFSGTVEAYAPVEAEGDISVVTNPIGVLVQSAAYKTLGTTPLTLDKAAYIGKSIHLVHEDTVTTVRITASTNIVDITFVNKNAADIYGNAQKENAQKGALVIHKFAVSSISVTKGDSVTISWTVENARNIKLLRNGKLWHKNLYGSGSKTLRLFENGRKKEGQEVFSLVAESMDGKEQKTQKQVVAVNNKKKIEWAAVLFAVFAIIFLGAFFFKMFSSNSQDRNGVTTELPPATPDSETATPSAPANNQQSVGYHSGTEITPTYSDADYKQIIRDYIAAEDERDFDKIYPYFSGNMVRYWSLTYPDKHELRMAFIHNWSIALNSRNDIISIIKVSDKAFNLYTVFEYNSQDGTYHSVSSTVRFVMDSDGKILSISKAD